MIFVSMVILILALLGISGTRTLFIRSPASSTAGSPHRFIAAEAGVYNRGSFDPGGATGKICFPTQGEI
jgi:hypothetical protein